MKARVCGFVYQDAGGRKGTCQRAFQGQTQSIQRKKNCSGSVDPRERAAHSRIWIIPFRSHSSCVGAVLKNFITSSTSTNPSPLVPTFSLTHS